MSCCYLQETWAVIFGWVELSAPRSIHIMSTIQLVHGGGDTQGVGFRAKVFRLRKQRSAVSHTSLVLESLGIDIVEPPSL